jgi:hypothetical protein
MEVRGQLAARFEVLLPHLNERQQRLALAVEARLLGHGGVRAVAQVAGVSETTVRKGVFELEAGQVGAASRPPGRTLRSSRPCWRWWSRTSGVIRRRRCGGRPSRCGTWPGAHPPGPSGLRPDGGPTVEAGRVQPAGQRQDARGKQHADRDAQFRYLNQQVKDHQADGEPVVSVGTKKREQLGRLPMAGRGWHPRVSRSRWKTTTCCFTGPEVEQAIP